MRILLVVTKSVRAGAQRYVLALAQGLARAGEQVTVLAGEDGWLTEELRAAGIQARIFPTLRRSGNPLTMLAFVWQLRRFLRQEKFEVVHFNSSNALFGALATVGFKARPKIVFTVHGLSVMHPGWCQSWPVKVVYGAVMDVLMRFADRVIFYARFDRDFAIKKHLVRQNQTVLTVTGTEQCFFSREEARRILKTLLPSADIGPETKIVGTLARFDYQKNLEILIEAAELLRKRDYRFCLLGQGADRLSLEALIKKLGLEQRVYIGTGDVGPAVLPAFDVFALTSRYEGLPFALLEAALARVPFVSTNVGGVPEIFEHGTSARLIAPGDVTALAHEIDFLMQNPDLARRQSDRAYQIVSQNHTQARMVEETQKVYAALIQP